MNISEKRKNECSGCTACMNACPVSAITMVEDEEGFLYPSIDKNKCTNCGICTQKCPFSDTWYKENKSTEQNVYALKCKDNEIRSKSTSGGIFSTIAEYVFEQKGVVYGAVFDDNLTVRHMRFTNKESLERLRGSKYVQSDLSDIFKKVKEDLKQQRQVLFVGTPCQIAGLTSFLNYDYDNLIKVDMVCHGVPSPKIFQDHINYIQKKTGKKVDNYLFRSKVNGWHNHTETVVFEDGTIDYKSNYSQAFKHLYAEHSILRKSCNNCKFCSINRISDLTMGDYWGIERSHKEFDDNKGVSLLIVNTLKGRKIFDILKKKITYIETKKEDCLQSNLVTPTKVSPKREKFWKNYFEYGYEYITKKYSCCGWKMKWLIKIKNITPQKFKIIIKKILKR